MESKQLKELKKSTNGIKPALNIGKSGITKGTIETVEKYLEKHRIMKIKLNSVEGKEEVKELAKEVSKKTSSDIIDLKGFTFTIYKKE